MADFAPNYTVRYRVRYSTLGHTHVMLWRIQRGTFGANLGALVAKVTAFLNDLTAARYTDWTVLGADAATEDSDIFTPATAPTPAAGTAVIPADPISEGILSTSFVGRSYAGQKTRLFVYGLLLAPEVVLGATPFDNFRVTGAELASIATAVGRLNNNSPALVGSDNVNTTWYSYVNTKYNDFWLRKIRT